LAFRYLALTVRYGRKLNLSAASFEAARSALASLRGRLGALGPPPPSGPWAAPSPLRAGRAPDRPEGIVAGLAGHGAANAGFVAGDRAHAPKAPLSTAGRALHDRFVAALDDDLDLPTCLAVVRETLRADLAADERRWLVLDADLVLGLDLDLAWSERRADETAEAAPAAIARLLEERGAARASRDWSRADALRSEIDAAGWEVVDGPAGSTLRRRPSVP
jgi:cysteinyl-tRNA synthetase